MVLLAEAEPAAKKAKTEEVVEEVVEKKATNVEPAPELETDAVADKSPKIKEKVGFLVQDTTMNVADSTFGNMLTCLTDGGLQYLLGGARASVGMKSGRYMFEMNVVELMNQKQDQATMTGKVPQPRNFFRVGLSTAGSSLLIGEDEESIAFDAEGSFIHNKKKTSCGAKFERCMTVGVLVNLDAKSPNANTVSIFKDGERVCKAQALPESLKGKALFPTITYRNVTVHYNFGPMATAPLPFTCPMLQEASAKDVVVSKEVVPKDGKYTAVFPVCLPDEGGFQWLDNWLQENPGYTELSDRAILDWAQKSGVARLKPYSQRVCNDKPEMSFGLPPMDDKSIQKMMATTAWMQKRNFVVMEMNANLLKDDRSKLITSFGDFKKVAMVVTGPPPKAFQQLTQKAVLAEKQDAANAELKKKIEEERKKKVAEKVKKAKEKAAKKAEKAALKAKEAAKKEREEKQKQLHEAMKKKAADVRKAVAEKKKKAEEEKKAAAVAAGEAEATEEVVEEAKEEEDAKMEEEEVKEEAKEEVKEESEESEAEPVEEEQADAEPPAVELTDEEKQLVFKPCSTPDVTSASINAAFSKYTLPEKAEGFDEITYEWANATKSAEHLSAWRQAKKITARIEDLKPGDWFDEKQKAWSNFLTLCKQKQNDYKAALAKTAADKLAREKAKQMKELKKKAAEKAKKDAKEKAEKIAQAKKEKIAAEKAKKAEERQKKIDAGEEVPEEEPEEPEKEEAEPMEVEEEEKAESEEEALSEDEPVDLEAVDVFGAEDIMEIGGKPKQPLFSHFNFEDWALMSLHFELNLLVHAFKKDVADAERAVIHEDNIGFYYQKYYRKGLNPAFFGVKTTRDLVKFFDGTLTITGRKVLETCLPMDFEALNMFVLLAETARRDRLRRIDLGEDAAQIKMQSVTAGAAAISGVSTAQMGAVQNLAAARAAILGGVVRPPYQPMGVRPPTQYAGAPAPMGKGAWGPAVAPMGKGAWGPARPAYSPYGPPGGAYGPPLGYKGGW